MRFILWLKCEIVVKRKEIDPQDQSLFDIVVVCRITCSYHHLLGSLDLIRSLTCQKQGM